MTALIIKIYSFLLGLYPGEFRKDFREQMLHDFSEMAVDAERKGGYSLFLFCLRELVDFPVNLLRVHFDEGRIFKILRSQPVNTGLRSALGFGVVFALTLPISMFFYGKLFLWLDSFETQLQIYYYDRFHTELGFELFLWIPSTLSDIATGLVLGILLALLFADRSQYSRYILAGTLGWFLSHLIGNVWASFNLWVYLDEIQFVYFDYMVLAFSGTLFGLTFVVAHSERREAVRWFAVSVFAYPLFIYLWLEQLFELFVFRNPLRFVGLLCLMIILFASVFIFARKIIGNRKLLWVIVAGAVGHPVTRLLLLTVGRLIYPQMTTLDSTTTNWEISISNLIYGTLFGLFLGLGIGFHNKSSPPETVVSIQ